MFTSYFVTVPAGATALQVNLSGIATGSQTRFIAINPYGVPVENTASTGLLHQLLRPGGLQAAGAGLPEPAAGRLGDRGRGPAYLAGAGEPVPADRPGAGRRGRAGRGRTAQRHRRHADPGDLDVDQHVRPGHRHRSGWPARQRRRQPADDRHRPDADVPRSRCPRAPPGWTSRSVTPPTRRRPGPVRPQRRGVEQGQSADGDSEEAVSLTNPPAGAYDIEVDGYAVPSGTTQYDYRDVFYSASLGAVAVPAAAVTLANGATTTITGSVTAQAAPAAGRQLFGEMVVVTSEGAVVGRGNVAIGAVS